jgi:hypothetical protein
MPITSPGKPSQGSAGAMMNSSQKTRFLVVVVACSSTLSNIQTFMNQAWFILWGRFLASNWVITAPLRNEAHFILMMSPILKLGFRILYKMVGYRELHLLILVSRYHVVIVEKKKCFKAMRDGRGLPCHSRRAPQA